MRKTHVCVCTGEYEDETQVTISVLAGYVTNKVESNQGVKLDNCQSRRKLTAFSPVSVL